MSVIDCSNEIRLRHWNASGNIWWTFEWTEELEKTTPRTFVREGWEYRAYWKMVKQIWSWSIIKWCANRKASKQNQRTE